MGKLPLSYQPLLIFLHRIGVLRAIGVSGYKTWPECDADGRRTGKMLEERWCQYPPDEDDDW